MSLGVRLKQKRDEFGLSQTALADRAGLTQQHISRYEQGSHYPTVEALIKLSTTLQVTTDWLLGLDEKDTLKGYSRVALTAARIINSLPEDQQRIALRLIEVIKLESDANGDT